MPKNLLPALVLLSLPCAAPAREPSLVGHRGLLLDAPENTLAGFRACLELRLGFEFDVRRSRDGHLVCVHDETVNRTTNGQGKVAELTLAELRKLDAGAWFDSRFAGQRIPTIEEIFALLARYKLAGIVIAVDLKIEGAEAELVQLAQKQGVLGSLVFIGKTIDTPAVRRRLRQASMETPIAVLAQTAKDLPAALADRDADWVYTRFVPSEDQVKSIRQTGKRLFLSGPPVNGRQPENWKAARLIGADALLTDYPLECLRGWRGR